jgi:hypothetical protein
MANSGVNMPEIECPYTNKAITNYDGLYGEFGSEFRSKVAIVSMPRRSAGRGSHLTPI